LTIAVIGIGSSLLSVWATQNYLWRIPVPVDHSHPRALLVDQLALNYPDPEFVANLTNALVAGGYQVNYWGPSSAAVDMFRQLPEGGYELVIIRSHIGSSQAIITTEPYSSSKYLVDQLDGALVPAQVGNGPLYFALTGQFVRQDMVGRFPQSTIIIMGCSAFQGVGGLAPAFLDKGANFFIGWDGTVTILHTDQSTVSLAQQLSSGKSVHEAISVAGAADPVYGARFEVADWSSLVQDRMNGLVSAVTFWVAVAAILVFGPAAVFLAPKLFELLERARRASVRSRKASSEHRSGKAG
jgi:hypothetical protein